MLLLLLFSTVFTVAFSIDDCGFDRAFERSWAHAHHLLGMRIYERHTPKYRIETKVAAPVYILPKHGPVVAGYTAPMIPYPRRCSGRHFRYAMGGIRIFERHTPKYIIGTKIASPSYLLPKHDPVVTSIPYMPSLRQCSCCPRPVVVRPTKVVMPPPPPPVIVRPGPVYVKPPPVIVRSPTVFVKPPPVFVKPAPVVVKQPPVFVKPTPIMVKPPSVYVKPSNVFVKPPPVFVRPDPVYVRPPPVFIKSPTMVVKPAPVILKPAPVVVRPTTECIKEQAIDIRPPPMLSHPGSLFRYQRIR